jgi:hypothetical protein
MTTDRDFDRIAMAWLADGPDELSDRVLDAAIDQIHLTRQRRALRVPWRFPTMTTPARVAAAAAIGVLVIGGALFTMRPSSSVGGPSPTPTPSASPTASSALPPLSDTFTSSRHGYSVNHPAGWTITPATRVWAPGTTTLWGDPALDSLTGADVRFVATSQRLPAGQTSAQWLRAYCELGGQGPTTCADVTNVWELIQIAGLNAYVDTNGIPAGGGTVFPGGKLFEALLVTGDRAYVLTMDGNLERAAFDAVLATVQLAPEDAVDLPPLTARFRSPTYGYSIGIADGWTTKPATERWVGPDNSGPVIDQVSMSGTDTSLTAASQKLPIGTTYAAWLASFHENTIANVPKNCDGGDPSTWPAIAIGPETGRLEMLCNAAEALVQVGDRVYVFDWSNARFDKESQLGIASWVRLLESVTFDPGAATG